MLLFLTRLFLASTSLLSPTHHQSGDEEDDRDYVPPAPDDWKKSPRVGADYQVFLRYGVITFRFRFEKDRFKQIICRKNSSYLRSYGRMFR